MTIVKCETLTLLEAKKNYMEHWLLVQLWALTYLHILVKNSYVKASQT